MCNRCVVIATMVVTFVPASSWMHAAQSTPAPTCRPTGPTVKLESLPEASGLAASRSTPGRLWAHNDSGKPEITALDDKGTTVGRVAITGARVEDWEGLASAPCGNGACLYIGDIGDNEAERKDITVYRVLEPVMAVGTVPVDGVFRASYPDGPHDAEALLASPNGTLYVVTKGDTGPVALYRFPQALRTDTTMRLERVGSPLADKPSASMRVTDGAVSRDGAWVALRTSATLTFYRATEFFRGEFRAVRRTDLKGVGEPQGEAVAFGPSNNIIYLAGEGGGKKQPGTLAVLSCGL
jgi:hypothetical protein